VAGRRRLLACVAVIAGVAALALGLPALAGAIPPQRAVPAEVRLDVGAGVSVVPGERTSLDARGTSPSENTVLLEIGGVNYRIQAEAFDGTLAELNDAARRIVADQRGPQALGRETEIRTDQGVRGIAGRFAGADGGGWYQVYASGGVGVIVLVTGSDAALVAHADDVDRVLATLRMPT
jgi:hypothetical protein